VNASLFVLKFEFTLLSPFLWCLELEEGALRVSSVNSKTLSVVDLEAVDPYIDIQGLVDGGEVLDFLIDNEPWIEEQLSSLVDGPDPQGPICAACDQLVDLLHIDHVKNGALVPNDGLEARILLGALGFPKLDGPISRGRYNHI
jgi:hypothetical protein